MKKNRCVTCGNTINKSALSDPYLCRACEREHGIELARYRWLDYA